ncbi:pyridoxal phosphate-dependent aminotransferase [Rouxiella badensis]|jgi:aspartate aminotransferase|uniref:pyridoxal phosphate-dependent aminotransferase n=1 Tax=Rouxiella badensis TaxID=1646377 RepID=UPI0013EF1DA8|nr:pyridoxal phosphate-dependent aminotransferase [Rouxiella badensis]QII38159.1 pyridoxal phosphate-dependent aminotransferase [Rouxiella badensis]QOI55737.1 pyridoxal phosphate-dependent aminotransferase [Rouxiella badensis subsp. acadiensis]WAT09575.1 pyridoxal phosphate-dependent aminotransferase [Rouxiella badensis]
MNPAHPEQKLAARLSSVTPSVTLVISQLARRLASQGRDIINMSSGELDFDTPQHIQDSAFTAMQAGQTRYTDVGGTAELKASIIEKFARDNHLAYSAKQIIASTGAKQIIFNAFLATLDAGDEVILNAPYWVSYPDMIRLTGAEPVAVVPAPHEGFKLTPASLAAALTPHTRWLLLNSPGNPSGALYSTDELRALAEVLKDYPRVLVMSDDIYEHIVYEGEFVSFATAVPEMADRTLTVNGVSKTYAMTGWRLGFAGGPEWLIAALAMLQSQSTSCPNAIAQAAAIAALDGPQHLLAEWCHRLRRRRDSALNILRQSPDLSVETPPSAFYLFVGCEKLLGKTTPTGKTLNSDLDVAEYFLEHGGVAVVPGTAFGMAPYFRLAYSIADEDVNRACQLMVNACEALL